MQQSVAGKLLVAEPWLPGDAFAKSVIAMLEHTPTGALGVVLNQPTMLPVGDALPAWSDQVAPPGVVFTGGPVSPEVAICLAEWSGYDTGDELDGWQQAVGPVGTLDVSKAPYEFGVEFGRVRLFSGYAGWSEGQLDSEIETGSWIVLERDDDDLFTSDPSQLWSTVLRRQGGRLATVALYPDDPSVN